jgi:transcriptional antiterminator RfaH
MIGGEAVSWVVIYTKPRQEVRAKENLERMGLQVSYPLRPIEKIRQGTMTVNFECLFPRYIFVRNEAGIFQKVMHTLRNVRGVSQILKYGGKLAEVDDQTLKKIEQFQRALSIQPVRLYQEGQEVVFTHGVFKDIRAIYKESDGDKRVILLFDLLNKPTKLSVPLAAIKRG